MLNEIKRLIKKSYDVWRRKRWLDRVAKECKLHGKYSAKSKRHLRRADALLNEYQEKYPD